jgi:hypothetical protein
MKLKDFYKGELDIWSIEKTFLDIQNFGIKEVEVSKDELDLIIRDFLANSADTNVGANVKIEWKLDKFMGIKLILE